MKLEKCPQEEKRSIEEDECGGNRTRDIEVEEEAGEMAQQVRTPTALLKVMSSNPRNHMVAHNHL